MYHMQKEKDKYQVSLKLSSKIERRNIGVNAARMQFYGYFDLPGEGSTPTNRPIFLNQIFAQAVEIRAVSILPGKIKITGKTAVLRRVERQYFSFLF